MVSTYGYTRAYEPPALALPHICNGEISIRFVWNDPRIEPSPLFPWDVVTVQYTVKGLNGVSRSHVGRDSNPGPTPLLIHRNAKYGIITL